jgi:hypothetical protein
MLIQHPIWNGVHGAVLQLNLNVVSRHELELTDDPDLLSEGWMESVMDFG